MLSRAFMTVLTLSLIGCADLPTSAPKPPPIPKCDLIAVEDGNPYLRCQWSTGGDYWRVPIATIWQHPTKYLCTTDQGYADSQDYARALKRWSDKHCQ